MARKGKRKGKKSVARKAAAFGGVMRTGGNRPSRGTSMRAGKKGKR